MKNERILIATDMTADADRAVDYGRYLAGISGRGLTLLHIHDDTTETTTDLTDKLDGISKRISEESKIDCDFVLKEGRNIFQEIPATASEERYGMMIIATHGIQGIRQKLVGADILKLVRMIPIPVIVVQKGTVVPASGIRRILFPVGGHKAYDRKIDAAIDLAKVFKAEVQIFSIEKPGYQITGLLKENVEKAKESFEKASVKYTKVNEPQSVFSVGYAKQTLKYAEQNDIQIISIVSVSTRENYFFADSDKESLLTNELNIPILCTSDIEK